MDLVLCLCPLYSSIRYHGTVCIDKAWIDENCIEQALLDVFEKSQVDLVRSAVENKKGIAESGSTGLAVPLKGNKI